MQWVMKPCWLGVPSTLKTGMGLSSGDTNMFWASAYALSMNVPPALSRLGLEFQWFDL